MPRLVRTKPWQERIKDYLNPGDFLLWLSEEFETRDWDSKQVGTPVALGLHAVMLIARANSGSSYGRGRDDVFGDYESGSGWLSYIVSLMLVKESFADPSGYFPCHLFDWTLYCERDLHIFSEASLSTI